MSVCRGLGLAALVVSCGGLSGTSNDSGGVAARAGASSGGSTTTGGTGGSSGTGGSGGAVSAGGAGGASSVGGAAMAGGDGGTGNSGGAGGSGGSSGAAGGLQLGGASGASGAAGVSGTAGTAGVGGNDRVSYGAVITNGIDCCDFVTVLRADYETDTCIFFEIVIEIGGTIELPRFASAFPGADHCCPNDPAFAQLCNTDTGCPVATRVMGAVTVDSARLDIGLSLEFEAASWLPPVVDFSVEDLPLNACPVRKSLPRCLQPRDSGSCDAAFTRFAFDPETLTCVPFPYGGCEGNENRFETPEACEAACIAPLPSECADASRGRGCPCTAHEQCSSMCSSVPFEEGEPCAPSTVGYCQSVSEGSCACDVDTGERVCGV